MTITSANIRYGSWLEAELDLKPLDMNTDRMAGVLWFGTSQTRSGRNPPEVYFSHKIFQSTFDGRKNK
jgi:hypothetical protein